MDLGLTGRVALITGGSRGIGHATARRLAAEGARVAVTYRSAEAEAQALVRELERVGGAALAAPLDLASFASIEQAIGEVVERWGGIEILVNNAFDFGPRLIAETPLFEDADPEEWQALMRANIDGTLRVTQKVVALMRRQQWGRIVNVSSTLAVDGLPRGAYYATSKAALGGVTRTLAKELGPSGILVNAVMPGLTNTERIAYISRERRSWIEAHLPIRRILQPDDIAHLIVFLSSAANRSLTGEILRASGGRL